MQSENRSAENAACLRSSPHPLRRATGRVLWCCPKSVLATLNFVVVDDADEAAVACLRYTDKFFTPESFPTFPKAQIVNKIPYMEELCYKTRLFSLLRSHAERIPPSFKFIPKLFLLPAEAASFVSAVEHGEEHDRWIVKPAGGQCGLGLEIVCGGDGELAERVARGGPAVAQVYIDPLLFGKGEGPWARDPARHPISFSGHKWDCRLYLLLMHNINGVPFSVYFYGDGLLKFCSEPYVDPVADDWDPCADHESCD
jgi:hypothetical protein